VEVPVRAAASDCPVISNPSSARSLEPPPALPWCRAVRFPTGRVTPRPGVITTFQLSEFSAIHLGKPLHPGCSGWAIDRTFRRRRQRIHSSPLRPVNTPRTRPARSTVIARQSTSITANCLAISAIADTAQSFRRPPRRCWVLPAGPAGQTAQLQ